MRVLLVSGKGGVGKSTIAAATALGLAQKGQRVLLTSADAAHSLSDVVRQPVGDTPSPIAVNQSIPGELHAQQPDAQLRMETHWRAILDLVEDERRKNRVHLPEAAELVLLPGLTETISLIDLVDQADAGWDSIVVDCAPTAESFQLLNFPEALATWLDDLSWVQRTAFGGLNRRMWRAIEALEDVLNELIAARELLTDPKTTAARLVFVPEEVVTNETLRAVGHYNLLQIAVGDLVANRLLPADVSDQRLQLRRSAQIEQVEIARSAVPDLPVHEIDDSFEDVGGVDGLHHLDLEGLSQPAGLAPYRGPQVTDDGWSWQLPLPAFQPSEVDAFHAPDVLVVTAGLVRRRFGAEVGLRPGEIKAAFESNVLTLRQEW